VPGKKELKVDEELVNKSGKLLVLDAMLVKLKQRGHKVHWFSLLLICLLNVSTPPVTFLST
jgi:ATP-dependent DNA helicase